MGAGQSNFAEIIAHNLYETDTALNRERYLLFAYTLFPAEINPVQLQKVLIYAQGIVGAFLSNVGSLFPLEQFFATYFNLMSNASSHVMNCTSSGKNTVRLLFAVLMNAQHLLPNPYTPDAVRLAHFIETSTENFIFGWLVVWLLNRHHASFRELFQWSKRTGWSLRLTTGFAAFVHLAHAACGGFAEFNIVKPKHPPAKNFE